MNMSEIKNIKHPFLKYVLFLFLSTIIITGCEKDEAYSDSIYRQYMRTFIGEISDYARELDTDFIIIPQNGTELLTHNGEPNGIIYAAYANAIDAYEYFEE